MQPYIPNQQPWTTMKHSENPFFIPQLEPSSAHHCVVTEPTTMHPVQWLWTMSLLSLPSSWSDSSDSPSKPEKFSLASQTNTILLQQLSAWLKSSPESFPFYQLHDAVTASHSTILHIFVTLTLLNHYQLSRTIILESFKSCKPCTEHSSTSYKTDISDFSSLLNKYPCRQSQ